MFIRNLKFFALMALSLPTALSAMNPDGEKDLVIAYRLPPHKQNILFHALVEDAIPGKPRPDYHVTLFKVEKVKPEDYIPLQNLLQSTADIHRDKATFTPIGAAKYQVNRSQDKSSIALFPTINEADKLKTINGFLDRTFQQYKTETAKQYNVAPDVMPQNYVSHVTLVDSNHINAHLLDRAALENVFNTRLRGTTLELLQQPKPVENRKPTISKHKHKKPQAQKQRQARRAAFRNHRHIKRSAAPRRKHYVRHGAKKHAHRAHGRRHRRR